MTADLDITPANDLETHARLGLALSELGASPCTSHGGDPAPQPLAADGGWLETSSLHRLATTAGALDVLFRPSGTSGYEDLVRNAEVMVVHGTRVPVASLPDVIRSKQAAGRARDRLELPTLRRLLRVIDGHYKLAATTRLDAPIA